MEEFWKNPSYSCPMDVQREARHDNWFELQCVSGRLGQREDRIRALESELAAARKAVDAADAMRVAGTNGSWSRGKYQPTDEALAYDVARQELRNSASPRPEPEHRDDGGGKERET
ncbi:MAG TPA: hypothetical protein VL494_13920 [Steroidobacteraceae bacterium]|jgi:hypothetical protein|nr:hypothetical protein [Steroidobacteraceae bacterium]